MEGPGKLLRWSLEGLLRDEYMTTFCGDLWKSDGFRRVLLHWRSEKSVNILTIESHHWASRIVINRLLFAFSNDDRKI
jgi:predicted alpha/beta-fold hydrolase